MHLCSWNRKKPFTIFLRENRGAKFPKKSLGCASEPFARELPCGKRVRWNSGGRRPTDLARIRLCQPLEDNVNAFFSKRRFQLNKRRQVFLGAHDETLSVAATGV